MKNSVFSKLLMLGIMLTVTLQLSSQSNKEQEVINDFFSQLPSLLSNNDYFLYITITEGNFFVSPKKENCDTCSYLLLVRDSLRKIYPSKKKFDGTYRDNRIGQYWSNIYPEYPIDSLMSDAKATVCLNVEDIKAPPGLTLKAYSKGFGLRKLRKEYEMVFNKENYSALLGLIDFTRIYFDETYSHAAMLYWYTDKDPRSWTLVLFKNDNGFWKIIENKGIGILD